MELELQKEKRNRDELDTKYINLLCEKEKLDQDFKLCEQDS